MRLLSFLKSLKRASRLMLTPWGEEALEEVAGWEGAVEWASFLMMRMTLNTISRAMTPTRILLFIINYI